MMHRLRVAVSALSLLAVAVWLGGILVLGAIVAPTVFRVVHAPASADAMTRGFLRFDKVAMSAAVVLAICEVAASRIAPLRRIDLARFALSAVASALAFAQGLWLSPQIAHLHIAGAVRGSGALGKALESAHHLSELCGKTESAALAAYLVLAVAALAQRPPAPPQAA